MGAIAERELEFAVGFDVTEPTGLLHLSLWPSGSRVLARRKETHPGPICNFFHPHGLPRQALITKYQDPDIAYLEARHRLHTVVEDRIKGAKDCGLANLPCTSFQVWAITNSAMS
ncbi:MAG: hypothetical protein WA809_01360 [Candidatus Dormiibacterota bacterium]